MPCSNTTTGSPEPSVRTRSRSADPLVPVPGRHPRTAGAVTCRTDHPSAAHTTTTAMVSRTGLVGRRAALLQIMSCARLLDASRYRHLSTGIPSPTGSEAPSSGLLPSAIQRSPARNHACVALAPHRERLSQGMRYFLRLHLGVVPEQDETHG